MKAKRAPRHDRALEEANLAKVVEALGISPLQVENDTLAADAEEKLIDFFEFSWRDLEPIVTFVRGWALEAICEHLQAVTLGEIQRLLITVPPGFSKSLATSVVWPAWEWGPRNRPNEKYLCAAYAKELAQRDNQKFRMLITSPSYQAYWGTRFVPGELVEEIDPLWDQRFELLGDQNTKTKIQNNHHGFKQALSSGSGTGERGSRIIVDDGHSVKDTDSDPKREGQVRWFAETMTSRTTVKRAAFVVCGQRIHSRDIPGHILEKGLDYYHLSIPMEFDSEYEAKPRKSWSGWRGDPRKVDGELAFPELFDRERVDLMKTELRSHGGDYAVAGQLQQQPTPRGGGLFKKDNFQTIAAALEMLPDGRMVRAWDLAGTKDDKSPFTVGVKMWMSQRRIVVGDVVRIQGNPAEVDALILATAAADGFDVDIDLPQDPGQAGKSQVFAFVQQLQGYAVYWSPESGDKTLRARPYASQVAAMNVYLVAAPWNDAYKTEHGSFPTGTLKDQVDASSRGYARLLQAPPPPLVGVVTPYRGSVTL